MGAIPRLYVHSNSLALEPRGGLSRNLTMFAHGTWPAACLAVGKLLLYLCCKTRSSNNNDFDDEEDGWSDHADLADMSQADAPAASKPNSFLEAACKGGTAEEVPIPASAGIGTSCELLRARYQICFCLISIQMHWLSRHCYSQVEQVSVCTVYFI